MLPKNPSLDLRLSFIWKIRAYKMKINNDPECQVSQWIFNEIELIWTAFALLTSAHCDDLVYQIRQTLFTYGQLQTATYFKLLFYSTSKGPKLQNLLF